MIRFATAVLLSALALPLAAADAPRVFGEAMPAGEAQPIAVAIAAADASSREPRKFSGRITEVCQAKGCWVMLEDEARVARVMMKDHAFSVPKDARGRAHVYGTLSVEDLDEATAKHLAEDAANGKAVAAREYRIEALSVELVGG